MGSFLIIFGVLGAMAAAVGWQVEQEKKEKKAKEKEERQTKLKAEQEHIRQYGSTTPWDMPEPVRTFTPAHEHPQAWNLKQNWGSSDFSEQGSEPVLAEAPPGHFDKNASDFLEANAPYGDFGLPDIELTSSQWRQITRTVLILGRAYESGVSKIKATEVIMGLTKGGGPKYKRFEEIWDEIKDFG